MLTVEQAVAEAIANNVGVLAERANVPVAEATVITARLKPNPVLSLGADHLDVLGTRYNTLNNAGPNEVNARIDFLIERAKKRGFGGDGLVQPADCGVAVGGGDSGIAGECGEWVRGPDSGEGEPGFGAGDSEDLRRSLSA